MYGERLARVVLLGSRAQGDAGLESDYDVAIFLLDFHDRWAEIDRLMPLVDRHLAHDKGVLIHDALPR